MIHCFIAGMDLLQRTADQISGIDCGLGTLLCQLTDPPGNLGFKPPK